MKKLELINELTEDLSGIINSISEYNEKLVSAAESYNDNPSDPSSLNVTKSFRQKSEGALSELKEQFTLLHIVESEVKMNESIVVLDGEFHIG